MTVFTGVARRIGLRIFAGGAVWLALALAVGAVALPLPGLAQGQDSRGAAEASDGMDPAAERATTFRAMEGPARESVSGGTLLLTAYAIVWLAVFAYMIRLGRLHASLAQSVERLSRALERIPEDPPSAPKG